MQVDDAQLELIKKCEEMGMGSPWSCTVCKSAVEKLDKSVKQIASRVTVIEARTETLEKSAEELKQENKDLKEEMSIIKEKLTAVDKKVSDNSGDKILEEDNRSGSGRLCERFSDAR